MKQIIFLIVIVIAAILVVVQLTSGDYAVVMLNGNRDTINVVSHSRMHSGDTICLEKLSYDTNTWEWSSVSTKMQGTHTIEPVAVFEEASQNSCGVYVSVFSREEWDTYNLRQEHGTFFPNGKRERAKAVVIEKKWFWSD
jgi:hypothetical protein